MFRYLVILTILPAPILMGQVSFSKCMKIPFYSVLLLKKPCFSSKGLAWSQPNSMEIDGCDHFPCRLVRYQNVTVTAAFTSQKAADELKVLLRLSNSQYTANVTPTFVDGCKTATCPVSIGQNIAVRVTANVDIETDWLVTHHMYLIIMVINEKREHLTCAETKVLYIY